MTPCILEIRVHDFIETDASVFRVLNVSCDAEDIQVQDKETGTGAANRLAIAPPGLPLYLDIPFLSAVMF